MTEVRLYVEEVIDVLLQHVHSKRMPQRMGVKFRKACVTISNIVKGLA